MDTSERKDALRAELEKSIFEAFKIFDHEDNNAIDCRDVGSVIRSLGCCPSESELHDILSEMEEMESSSSVQFDKFLPVVIKILEEKRYPTSTYDQLFSAFQLLDTNRKGYLEWNELAEFLQKYGDCMSEEELDELSSAFVDPITKRVDYRDWITWMVSDD